MKHRKKVIDVTGSDDFSPFFKSLPESDPFKQELKEAIKTLKENCTCGDKIEHAKWPGYYIEKYGINNLWRYELQEGKRLTYTIISSADGLVVSILEAFFTHDDYDKRFGY